MSGADLARVANEAALGAIRRGLDVIDAACFDDAVELVALGRPRSGAVVTERDRRITAWHEAGHTVAALVLDDAEDPVAVSIVPRGPAGGVTWMGASDDRYLTRDQAEASLVVMLAGRAAEEVLLGGSCTQGASSDLLVATDLATSMVDRYGFTDRGLSVRNADSSASRRAVDALLEKAHLRARDLLEVHAGLLEAVADALLERDRLDARDLVVLRDHHTGVIQARVTAAPVGSTGTTVSRDIPQAVARPAVSLLRRLPRLAYRGVTAVRPRRRHRT
jgi:cell division protease FtsH